MENQPLCEAQEISKDFTSPHGQTLHVLDKIDLSVYPKEVVAVIGPSGCGKSTLLRIFAGLIPSTSGKVFYHGKLETGLMPGVSFVFQNFALYPWMTVKENIEMVLKAVHLPLEEIEKRTRETIALTGLSGFEDAYPREISGGMKQRVGIARALVRNPELLFMDEPFSEVDSFTAESLRSEVLKIWAQKEYPLSSILLVSHDVLEVAYMSDRIVVMSANPGRVRLVLENKLPRPRDYRSQEFLNLVNQLRDISTREEGSKGPTPEKEPIGPLLPVGRDQILGLLEYLNRHGGSQDIYQVAADSILHFEKIIAVVQMAELLDFVEMPHRTVVLTETGKKFLNASHNERRLICKEKVVKVPIFATVIEWLKQTPSHSMHRRELIERLSKELPHQDAHEQLNLLIRWGYYADLFIYHRKSKYLALAEPIHARK